MISEILREVSELNTLMMLLLNGYCNWLKGMIRQIGSRHGWKVVSTVEQGTPIDSALLMAKSCWEYRKTIYSKAVCRSLLRQQQEWRQPRWNRSINDIIQDKEPQPVEQQHHDRNFDSAKIKYLNFDNVKAVYLPNWSQVLVTKSACITYKIDSRSDATYSLSKS